MKVVIDNFQSIEHTEFEVKGLTVITGPNNTGKSACARAVAGALTNARGSSFVRQGEKACRVQITFKDGHTLLWEKGKSINRYEVDGFEINKVGSGVPDEVKSLGVVAVEVDGKEVYPQIAKQFEQIFLLDLPPSVLSSALSDVDKIQVLEQATALARNEVKSINNRIKVKSEDLLSENSKAKSFQDLSEAEASVQQVQNLQLQLSNIDQNIEALDMTLQNREALMKLINTLNDVLNINLPQVSEMSKFNALPELERIKRERAKCFVLDKSISIGLESLPEMPEIKGFEKIENLQRILNARNGYIKTSQELSNVLALDIGIQHHEVQVLNSLIEQATQRQVLSNGIGLASTEVHTLDKELDTLKSELGDVCPLCERGCTH